MILVVTACQPAASVPAGPIHATQMLRLPLSKQEFVPHKVTPLHPAWTSYTNANDVAAIVFDHEGILWTAGRGGVVKWDVNGRSVDIFNTEHGLPENYATALAVAGDGALWAGTYRGNIARFNGSSWEKVAAPVGDTVTALAVAPDGDIWAGSSRGVSRYDGKDWRLYTHKDGLVNDYIHSIAVTAGGAVWIGATGGVSSFDGSRWKTHPFPPGSEVLSIATTPDQVVWFGTTVGLTRYDGKTWTDYTLDSGNESNKIICSTVITPGGVLWCANRSTLYRFDGGTWTEYNSGNPSGISTVTIAPDGTVWVGLSQGGLQHFDEQKWEEFTITAGLPSSSVLSLGFASDGSLWAGTAQGAVHFNGDDWDRLDGSNSPIKDSVVAVGSSPDGSLWFGTERVVYHLEGTKWSAFPVITDNHEKNLHSLVVTPRGEVWALVDEGVALLNDTPFSNKGWTMILDNVKSFTVDADDTIWALQQDGLMRMANIGTVTIRFPHQDSASCVTMTDDGDLWLGTRTAGLILLKGAVWQAAGTERFSRMELEPDDSVSIDTYDGWKKVDGDFVQFFDQGSGLPDNTIHGITLSPDQTIWISTDTGVAHWDGTRWTSYTTSEGLGDNSAWSIAVDANGIVWIGMPLGGMSRFDTHIR